MNELDPITAMRDADPARHIDITPTKSADVLFDEITHGIVVDETPSDLVGVVAGESDGNVRHLSSRRQRRASASEYGAARRKAGASRRSWMPRVAIPAAAAIVAIATVGVIAVDGNGSPSASALVNEAAQSSAAFTSGHVVVQLNLVESPTDPMSGTMIIDHRYDGDDFSLVFDMTGLGDGGIPDAVARTEFRGVGDRLFTSVGNDQFVVEPSDPATIRSLFDMNPTTVEPRGVIELLERTDDFQRTSSADGTTTYRGSVTTSSLRDLGTESLPAGLNLLAEDGLEVDDLPAILPIQIVLDDGLLRSISIEIDGDTPAGYTEGSIEITFSDLGVAQGIEAPASGQLVDAPVFENAPPDEVVEAFRIVDDLDIRRPQLCSDGAAGTYEVLAYEPGSAEVESFARCLNEAGEQPAADAVVTISEWVGDD